MTLQYSSYYFAPEIGGQTFPTGLNVFMDKEKAKQIQRYYDYIRFTVLIIIVVIIGYYIV